ncbi:butyrophilin subfamily 3 member A3-like isoform X2 [Sparus aurata]|uniref:butyrophilin subfamily 3 member A3-like isoform X2 n=1 Tax=Sparus aurata TaxID=8175 RepID=UPI0011C14AEB|nr:butyrophilin subfamily 3 member A3-like isoform X2 [Sparus aurata]
MELLPLVCLCLLSCSGDAVRVVVKEGSDAVLPCLISTEVNLAGKLFVWRKDDQKEVFLYDGNIHYNYGRTGRDEQFKGRVSHFQDQLQNGNASIKITRTKMDDSGNYSCDFPRLQSQTSIIELVVAVRVLVKEGSDAVLPCWISTEVNLAGEVFAWRKDDQKEVLIHYPHSRTVQDLDFQGRVSHFQDQLQNGDASIKITRTKMADSGIYSCIFPDLQPRQTFYIELVVGAASKPSVTTIQTDDGTVLQCEVLDASPKPKVEWMDSSGNKLPVKDLKETKRGDSYDIVLRAAVIKTDTFRCVVTQKEINLQTEAETYATFNGSNTGAIVVVCVVVTIVAGVVLLAVLRALGCITLNCSRPNPTY